MKEQIENAMTRVADTARNTVNTAVDATQERGGKAGQVVDINNITFRLSKDLIELQTKSVQDGLDAVADGLQAAARADSVGNLLGYQRDALPKVLRGYATDIRDAFDLVRGAASDVGGVVVGLTEKSAPKKAKARAKSSAKAAKKTAKRTARKVSRKTPVRKAKTKTKAAANTVAKKVAEAQDTVQTA